MKLGGPEVVALLEHAYDVQLGEDAWHDALLEALVTMSGGVTVRNLRMRTTFERDGSFRWTPVGELRCFGPETTWETFAGSPLTANSSVAELAWGRTVGSTYSTLMAHGNGLTDEPTWKTVWHAGIDDVLGLISRDAHGDVFALVAGLEKVQSVDARAQRLLTKVAAHLGTADRLRRHATATTDNADAVLDAKGRFVHERDARAETRAAIDDGVSRRAFARKNRDAPEKALDVWHGLVAGRWSLVDFFDTDGKRFVLAMKNPPKVDRRADLTPRERRVASLVAMGHSDKETAYMLGLSVATVSTALRRARIKLGVHTRAELVSTWRESERK